MSEPLKNLTVSYGIGCIRSLKGVPQRTQLQFYDMMEKVLADPSRNGLNLERIEGARDKRIRSVRIDQGYRAIGFLSGRDFLLVHVNEHDKAYRWATNRKVMADAEGRRIRIVEVLEEDAAPSQRQAGLFDAWSDEVLLALGVTQEELRRVRLIVNEADLNREEPHFDTTTGTILTALAAGYTTEDVRALVGGTPAFTPESETSATTNFEVALRTPESRQTIFIPESEAELRRVMEGDMRAWRVFLHPDQRRIAYRDYSGPVLVRGGAGTGKTVVAMHRARYLADKLSSAPKGRRVLVTTFTTNLALDIESNLKDLCPEHFTPGQERIEVTNLDRWVTRFLKARGFGRKVVFDSRDDDIGAIWAEVVARHTNSGFSELFIRDEWEQVVCAKGITDKRAYLKASRAGRGTPLDRKARTTLWAIFDAFRARMLDQGIVEADEAYREATGLLTESSIALPYAAVIVDEAQDMGEQAFRLIRAIVPPIANGDSNTIFIVGDAHQRIYGRQASLSQCGIEVRGRSRRLKLNYRTTEEIRRWAVGVLEGVPVDDLDTGTDTLAGYRSLMFGPHPDLFGYTTRSEELAALVEWVKQLLKGGDDGRSIGVLARSQSVLDEAAHALRASDIEFRPLSRGRADNPSKPGVRLATMHRAKGLEFRHVAILAVENGTIPPSNALQAAADAVAERAAINREKSLLHVAATRAKETVRISWAGQPSTVLPHSASAE